MVDRGTADGCRRLMWLSLASLAGCGVPRGQAESSTTSVGSSGDETSEGPASCEPGDWCVSESEVCYYGDCVPRGPCDDPGDCIAPMVCVGETCVTPGPCDDGLDCGAGEVCELGNCTVAPELPACVPAIAMQTLFAIDHGTDLAHSIVFRDADGDSLRELAIGVSSGVVEVRGGTTEAVPLVGVDGVPRLLRAADLDGDGLEELAIAGDSLRTHNPASGDVIPWADSGALPEVALGALGSDRRHAAAALWHCPYLEGCGAEIELAHLGVTPQGGLAFAGNQVTAEPMLGLAIGHLGAQANSIVVDIPGGFRTFGLGEADFLLAEDHAVVGAGVLAIGDLDGGDYDEVVRLSPAETATVVSIYASTGETLLVVRRAGFDRELRVVRIGDIDGDAWRDVVMSDGTRVVVWLDAGAEATCVTEFVAPHAVSAVALGDPDGDGRDDVAVAGESSTTVLRVED